MSGIKQVMKNGWHPEKSGGSIRESVSGLMGRNKDSTSESSNRVARPLSDLKDPASFAPPPRRTGSGLPPALPPAESRTRRTVASPPSYASSQADSLERAPRNTNPPAIEASYSESQDEQRPQPTPYRVDTTGLSTQHLPRPPPRRDGADGRSPSMYSETKSTSPAPKAAGPPRLPPRLPPRRATSSPLAEENKSHGLLNGASIQRLGATGISVPALGIGRAGSATPSSSGRPPPPPSQPSHEASPSAGTAAGSGKWGSQINELQGRFANMKTSSSAPPAPAPASASAQNPPSQGTTWAQKQAAFKTASSFHKNPSSVSFSDAKAAATTANNFRQRHGEQVASGVKTANNLNQKYGLMDKVGGAYTGAQSALGQVPNGTTTAGLGTKKPPPPPPPKKKPGLVVAREDGEGPPPVPMGTRPAF
ncbi:hypothetical protein E4U56_006870 [Claviceps arundinis]|uniref:GMP synthase n=1 Tax=Claviceps arundinis TaxID=1623583 RepID=A0A9P7SS22_9HYPO|nr:hypothetical protein E4U56_006870 [Claviceps arundinis]